MAAVEKVIKSIMDCLEECFSTLTLASGRKLVYVLYSCLIFLGASILLEIFGLFAFVSWQEALAATIFVGVICAFDSVSQNQIKNVLKVIGKIEKKGDKKKDGSSK